MLTGRLNSIINLSYLILDVTGQKHVVSSQLDKTKMEKMFTEVDLQATE
jgi:hypothetical protein